MSVPPPDHVNCASDYYEACDCSYEDRMILWRAENRSDVNAAPLPRAIVIPKTAKAARRRLP